MREKSNRIARFIFNNDLNEEKIELYGFAIYIVISSLLHIGTLLVIGYLFGMVVESVIFYVSFIAIRKFAGGYHARTPLKCYFFSIVTIIIALFLLKIIKIFPIENVNCFFCILSVISLVIICVLSPLDNENKNIDCKDKIILKKISILNTTGLLIFFFLIMGIEKTYALAIALGLCVSSIVLLMRKIQIIKNTFIKLQ